MSVEASVNRYTGHFREQVRFVDSLRGDDSIAAGSSDPVIRAALHKKILYSAMLDSLAAVRYDREINSTGLGNKDRTLKLLEEHSGWPEGELISVPVLAERLQGRNSALVQAVAKRLSRYNTNRGNSLLVTAFDVPLSALLSVADEDEHQIVEKSTHYELYYAYRTFIVHEFREPGYGMEIFAGGGTEPRYHAPLGKNAKWRLLYPEAFFRVRIEKTIHSLAQYFLDAGINPYDHVPDTSAWVDARRPPYPRRRR